MSLLAEEIGFARAVSRLVYCNPFVPERIECERAALGPAFVADGADWNVHAERIDDHANLAAIRARVERLVENIRERLAAGASGDPADLRLYEDLVLFHLYHRHRAGLDAVLQASGQNRAAGFYATFAADAARLLGRTPGLQAVRNELPHLFACFFQIRRAFHEIFHFITGISRPAARFRAAVWQSIFTHDMSRYRRVLFDRMGDFTTLITGPSGTGKELAARAIGRSRYRAFDPRAGSFAGDRPGAEFCPVNLSALSPTLIESELFGHRRGSFTGAIADRAGWFESCPAAGTVFLDEIGELDRTIQVKLLRVLQTRTFQRIGDTKEMSFAGKIIAATNRDLGSLRRQGRFRDDLYYRLCSDQIAAPSLAERLRDTPAELGHLIRVLAQRLVGDEAEALTEEVEQFIERNLPRDYAWPGSVRELEQCVRNILIRKDYRAEPGAAAGELGGEVMAGALTADELLRRYCALVYEQCGSYSETARRLGLDRRTVRSRLAESAGDPGAQVGS